MRMVKITIELWPGGNREKAILLGEGEISNNLSGTETSGNYFYRLTAHKGKMAVSGGIQGYQRKRHSVWYLIFLVLQDAYRRK